MATCRRSARLVPEAPRTLDPARWQTLARIRASPALDMSQGNQDGERMAGSARHSVAEDRGPGARPSLPLTGLLNGHLAPTCRTLRGGGWSRRDRCVIATTLGSPESTRDGLMKQSMSADALVEGDIAMPSTRTAKVSLARIALLLLTTTTTSCSFPRPPDVVGDAPGDTGGKTGSAIHVSPSGDDSNDGLMSPIKTLKHAIGLAAANTQVSQIVLAAGTYSMSSGETFPYSVPPNVTIVGPAGGGATLDGDKTGPAISMGAGVLQDIDLQDFATAITVTGAATLKNIRVLTSAIAVQAETTAHLTVSNLDITGTVRVCATGIMLNGNATATISAFATRFLGPSLSANDHSMASLMNVNVTGDPSCTNISVLHILSDGAFMIDQTLVDGGGSGISVGSPPGGAPTQVVLENVTVRNVIADALSVRNATVRMMGGELSHTSATALEVIGGNCTLTDVSILSSGAAFYSQDATLTMRGCTVSNNTVGGDLGVNAVADLGTTMNPGKNVIKNVGLGLLVEGGNGTQLVQLVGNTWKPVQGADANGKYTQGTIVPGPISCDSNTGNFCLPVSNESLEL